MDTKKIAREKEEESLEDKMSRYYDKEFKMDAVALCQKSERSIASIANELGIAKSTLSSWIRIFGSNGSESFPGKGHMRSPDAELHALRRELQHVKLERDILKKAVAIFSSPSGKGTHS